MNPVRLKVPAPFPLKAFYLVSPSGPVPFSPGKALSFPEIFGNSDPVEVEIGSGKSRFLIERAAENPNRNFLGVDYAAKWLGIGSERGGRLGVGNLRFVRGEAFELLRGYILRESVSVFHIYFPDPWPKRRHQMRRLLRREFIGLLYACLKPGGVVEIATDEKKYFEFIKGEILAADPEWGKMRETVNERLFGGAKTHYEAKFEAAGKPLHYLELEK